MKKLPKGSEMGLGIGLGLCFGILFDQLAVGLAIGVAIGAAMTGQNDKKHKEKEDIDQSKNASDKELKR